MKDVISLYSGEATVLRKIGADYKGQPPIKILYHGLVTYVDRDGVDGRPRFSCKVKVFGISNPQDLEWMNFKFYPPLLPIQLGVTPEVGEEVMLLCEEPGNLDTAYWIAGGTPSNKLQFTEAGERIQTDDNLQTREEKYGSIKLPTEKESEKPNPKYPENNPRTKPGDVVLQGRSNTYLRHSFDVKNRKGTIEVITEEETVSKNNRNSSNYRKTTGGRVLAATLSDLDSLIIDQINKLRFDRDFTKNGGKQKQDFAYLLLEAIELRLISRSGGTVQHIVLGEEQERWLKALIDLTKELIDDLVEFSKQVSQHKHMAQGPTSPPLPPQATYFSQQTPQTLEALRGAKTKSSDSGNYGNNFDGTKQYIPNHHSKNIAGN